VDRHFVVVEGFLGDSGTFSAFYRANARTLLLLFTRRTFDAEAALDLTAETFAEAFASRRAFRGATDEEAGGWLFTIARRQLARYFEAGRVSRDLVRRLGVVTPVAAGARRRGVGASSNSSCGPAATRTEPGLMVDRRRPLGVDLAA
jgi:DNA-directed RNA polymerase specialized sigma24 family protein